MYIYMYLNLFLKIIVMTWVGSPAGNKIVCIENPICFATLEDPRFPHFQGRKRMRWGIFRDTVGLILLMGTDPGNSLTS